MEKKLSALFISILLISFSQCVSNLKLKFKDYKIPDSNYLIGDWSCDNYRCGGLITEQIRCKHEGDNFRCVKTDANGDQCVTTGQDTMWGKIPTDFNSHNKAWINTTTKEGNKQNPNSSTVSNNSIYPRSENYFETYYGIKCTRKSKYGVDPSLPVSPPKPLYPPTPVYPPSPIYQQPTIYQQSPVVIQQPTIYQQQTPIYQQSTLI